VRARDCFVACLAGVASAVALCQDAGGSGSGFAVSPSGHVLTNAHVVEGCSEVEVVTSSGSHLGRVVSTDGRNDLALISSPVRGPYAAFRRGPLKAGEDVTALGYPLRGLLGSDISVSVGIVSALAGIRNDTSRLQVSTPVQPGNSGGPLLDASGAVSGVIVSKLNAVAVANATGDLPQNVNFAIKGEMAQAFLRSNGVEPRISHDGGRRVPVPEVVESARRFTHLIVCDPNRAAGVEARRQLAEREKTEREAARLEAKRQEQERQEQERQEAARQEQARRAAIANLDKEKEDAEREEAARRLAAASLEAQRAETERVAEERRRARESVRFSLPVDCLLNVNCRITSYVPSKNGLDYACGRLVDRAPGTTFVFDEAEGLRTDSVLAASDGKVIFQGADRVTIEHAGGWSTRYIMGDVSLQLRTGDFVKAGHVIGYGTPLRKNKVRAVVFVVELDGLHVDPFNPVPGTNPACGLAPNHLWAPQIASQLSYSPIVLIDSSFADEPIELAKIEHGSYRNRPDIASRWLSFWAWTQGERIGDEVEVSIIEPSGETLATAKLPVKALDVGRVARIQKQRFLMKWSAGTYIGRYSVVRDGAVVFSTDRRLDLR
jgi:murein DD-endopeptidase MepM/ murein hydrolase activator NlpD